MTILNSFNDELEDSIIITQLNNYLLNITAGATPSTKNKEYWDNGTIPWMSSGEIHIKGIDNTEKFITNLGYEKSSTKLLETNHILIALAGQGKTRGTVTYNSIKLCTNQSIAALKTNPDTLNYKYLYYLLTNDYEKLRSYSSGDGRGGLNLKIIREYKIKITTNVCIQNEISSLLSSIDKLINNKICYIDSIVDLKSYFINQQFNIEALKNREFVPLKSLCTNMNSGGTPKSSVEQYYKGDIPFMSISDIKKNKLVSTQKFISDVALDNSSTKIIRSGNLIYTMYATPGIAFENTIDVAIPQSVISIELNDKSLNVFIKEYLNYNKNNILKYAMTGTQSNLTGQIVKEIQIPEFSKSEIKKFTNFLSQMDNYSNTIFLINLYLKNHFEFMHTVLDFILHIIKIMNS